MDGAAYSAREVARIIGVAESRLGYWVKTGLVTPSLRPARRGGRGRFCFEDLVAARAAFELAERGVSLQALRKNLRALRGALPPPGSLPEGAPVGPGPRRALGRLRVVSDGEELVVVDKDVAWEPLSGQVVMDFVIGSLGERAAQVLALPAAPIDVEQSGWRWLCEALSLEDAGQPALAEQALQRALCADPTLAAAESNLGRLAQLGGRRGEAREHYLRALALDATLPEARFNLGNLWDEDGEHERARAAWAEVVAHHPDFADAHFNLGAALAQHGPAPPTATAARYHLERYLELDAVGPWADAARSLLGALALPPPADGSRAPEPRPL